MPHHGLRQRWRTLRPGPHSKSWISAFLKFSDLISSSYQRRRRHSITLSPERHQHRWRSTPEVHWVPGVSERATGRPEVASPSVPSSGAVTSRRRSRGLSLASGAAAPASGEHGRMCCLAVGPKAGERCCLRDAQDIVVVIVNRKTCALCVLMILLLWSYLLVILY